ncbi:uncharacterized protein LOC112458665 isoform X1 [Temnothorax curvispinosus]|uniref:Uncharacterized protein LOC112458665 isoform X1 n=1 Tax=Temnothorax curvispinosus TaxID=300111 RepID=A0A6J1QBM8_9HYME|nr:uncharacterized protein LOC112458665 isoform X1 [Temnothorax curvispinosus]XP_024878181.1 uncharacterized protein LOC112458665 isoform X1 [Temnothorax curvispinosus]XP_024878182.1 uncharacterized protein LOC112458665 isoform X1 [Temnothorax curvispinosus]
MVSPIKSVELSLGNSPATGEYLAKDLEVPKSPAVEVSLTSSSTLSFNSKPSSTKTDATPPNKALKFNKLVPLPSNNNNKNTKHSNNKKKRSHLTKKKHARKTSDKLRLKKNLEMEKVNVGDCLQKLTELVEKLTNQLEQSKQSCEKFEASVMQYLSTIESNWKQLQIIKKSTGARTSAVDNDENVHLEDINKSPVPGFIRKNGNEEKIHYGQNIWIDKMTYDNAVFDAHLDVMFIKNMALAIFGDKKLKRSSVTGASSNRTKSNPKPSLNLTKALAVRDIFRYFLELYRRYNKHKIEELVGDYQTFIRQRNL